ncbi:MAG TPA: hypothetical protein VHZ01_09390 [Casimicrobiaceae bacterium]|nr:hypothetical protein [Casimicrobiaceae bacterium]
MANAATGIAIRHAFAMADLINTIMGSPSVTVPADRLYATTVPTIAIASDYNRLAQKAEN